MNTMTPGKQLLLWVIEQGGRVHWPQFHRAGIEFGSPPPGQKFQWRHCLGAR